jgi:hypothetical protein
MTYPREAMLVVKRIGNIHRPIEHNFVAQACACIYPSYARATARTVVKNRSFNATELVMV